jgi:hypothetical protein
MLSSGMLRRVALAGTDISEESSASVIRVTRIGEVGTLAVTSNRRTLQQGCTSRRTGNRTSCNGISTVVLVTVEI